MSKHDFDDLRMCRVGSKQPITRERWVAFWRLFRVVKGRADEAQDCFRVLFHPRSLYGRFLALASAGDDPLTYNHQVPIFLRKEFLRTNRLKRLYNGHYKWLERDKAIAAQVRREGGIEVTPDEVAGVRRKLINLLRRKAVEFNVKLPQDDEDLLRWIGKGMKQ